MFGKIVFVNHKSNTFFKKHKQLPTVQIRLKKTPSEKNF